MDQNELKVKVRQTFDTVCEGYDCRSLRFFNKASAHLPQVFSFRGNEQLLDVAAGTGIPAMVCVAALPQGSVTAVDFSSGMLAQAETKARAAGLSNIHFQQMDMTAMALPEGSFDAANCSFGIFFVEKIKGDSPLFSNNRGQTIFGVREFCSDPEESPWLPTTRQDIYNSSDIWQASYPNRQRIQESDSCLCSG